MNVLLSLNLRKLNPEANFGLLYATPTVIVALDLLLKLVGLLISVTIFPAAMVLSILLASLLLIFFPKSAWNNMAIYENLQKNSCERNFVHSFRLPRLDSNQRPFD